MHILLFIVYSLLCAFGLVRMPFVRNSGIRPAVLLLFFGLHVLVGLLHNIIAWRYYPAHGDIWNFYQLSFTARHEIISDLAYFLKDRSMWTSITHNGIIWIYGALNFLSLDDMPINTLLFSFPVFLGNIALFRLFLRRFPDMPLAASTVFLLPSTLFWTACIHREGMLYMLLGLLLYSFDRLLLPRNNRSHSPHSTKPSPPNSTQPSPRKYFIIFVTSLILTFYFRFSMLFSLLPALAAWWLAEKRIPRRRILTSMAAGLLLFIVLIFIRPGLSHSLATGITARQLEFSGLEGNSRIPLPLMDGTWTSIIKVCPAAVRNGLFQPWPGYRGQAIYRAFAFELFLIWLITAAALLRLFFFPSPNPSNAPSTDASHPSTTFSPNAFIIACLVLSGSGLILIGAIVPFVGAIVRYRSIFLPFLLAPSFYILRNHRFIRGINNWINRFLFPKFGKKSHSY